MLNIYKRNTPDNGEEPESVVNYLYEYTPTTDKAHIISFNMEEVGK